MKNFVFLVKITQNRAGARHRGSDPSDSTRRPQERYGLNLAGRGLSERPQRDLGGYVRWPTRPGRPAERRSEALINWTGGWMVPIKIRSLGEFFDIKFWCYQKKKNRKKLQKLVLRFGTTGKKFGPKIFGGRPQVVVFSFGDFLS